MSIDGSGLAEPLSKKGAPEAELAVGTASMREFVDERRERRNSDTPVSVPSLDSYR
jgi:hypothetical protein